MRARFALLLLCLGLTGCATYAPTVPKGYTGPTAILWDGGLQEDGTRGQLYYLEEINGRPIDSSMVATGNATRGHGAALTLDYRINLLPAQPLQLKIVATSVMGAPIHQIAARIAGTYYHVEGVVNFTPEAGHHYYVKGRLAKGASQVWIVDAAAEDVPVSEVVQEAAK